MARKGPSFKVRRGTPRAEWPHRFRELASFLFTPERWAGARKIPWAEVLEDLRVAILLWLYHHAGAPTVWPNGSRNVVPVGPVFRPTARRVQRSVNKIQREEMAKIAVSAWAGDPNSLYFPPPVVEIAHTVAKELGIARARLRQPGAQRTVQSVVQRVINALAAQEKGEATSASESLERDTLGAFANERGLAREILSRFRSPNVRSRILGRVKDLLNRPAPSQFPQLKWLEQQGLSVQLLRDGTAGPFVPLGWLARADVFPSPAKEAIIPVLREADDAISVPWRICPLCARPFPRLGKMVAKACPPCRRRQKPLQVHRRLTRAPKDPVVFRVLPEGRPESVRLIIADGTRAPSSLRRIIAREASRGEVPLGGL